MAPGVIDIDGDTGCCYRPDYACVWTVAMGNASVIIVPQDNPPPEEE